MRIDQIIDWMNVNLDFIFSFIKDMLLRALVWLEDVMIWIRGQLSSSVSAFWDGEWQASALGCSRSRRC